MKPELRLGARLTAAVAMLAVATSPLAAADPPPDEPAPPVAPTTLPPGAGLLAGPVDPGAVTAPPPVEDRPVSTMGPLGALPGGGADLLLSQYPVPSTGGAPAAPPSADVLQDSQFLLPQNYRVPAPDEVSPYQLAPGTPGPFARVDGMKGVHAILQGALGRMPLDQLGQPLPGTAPAPGLTVPPGPVDLLPAAVPPPA